MKTVTEIKALIEQLEEEMATITAPTRNKLSALEDDLRRSYNAQFDADEMLQADIIAVQESKELTTTNGDEWFSQWVRCKSDLPKDSTVRQALTEYLRGTHYIEADFHNNCFTYSIGPCIIINDDGTVYDQDSGKWILKEDAYESREARNAAIEAWMEKHGYFPSVVQADYHNNYFYVNIQRKE